MTPASSEPPITHNVISGPRNARWPWLAQAVATAIRYGTYPAGKPLPVRILAEEYGVNHATVHRALQELRRLGYVELAGGRLRVAASPPQAQPLTAAPESLAGMAAPGARSGQAPATADRGRTRFGKSATHVLELLDMHGPLTSEDAARLDKDPGLGGDQDARILTLTRYGSALRRLERAGLVKRAGSEPGRQGKGAAVVWAITPHGRIKAAARISTNQLRLLVLLAGRGPLTTEQAARLDKARGMRGDSAERLRALKRYGDWMRVLEDGKLATRAGYEPSWNRGGPLIVWEATEEGIRIAALADQGALAASQG